MFLDDTDMVSLCVCHPGLPGVIEPTDRWLASKQLWQLDQGDSVYLVLQGRVRGRGLPRRMSRRVICDVLGCLCGRPPRAQNHDAMGHFGRG
jgi:hypothetical protein